MDVAHIHVQPRQYGHRFLHRIGNVVQLEVEENLVPPALDLTHDFRPFGIEQLHADLEERFACLAPEQVEEFEGIFRRLEVAGDNYVMLHIVRFYVHSTIPIMSLSRPIPSRCISAGSASTISFEA